MTYITTKLHRFLFSSFSVISRTYDAQTHTLTDGQEQKQYLAFAASLARRVTNQFVAQTVTDHPLLSIRCKL